MYGNVLPLCQQLSQLLNESMRLVYALGGRHLYDLKRQQCQPSLLHSTSVVLNLKALHQPYATLHHSEVLTLLELQFRPGYKHATRDMTQTCRR